MNARALLLAAVIVLAGVLAYKVFTGGDLLIDAWAQAIKTHEGWKPGSVSYRNNNPGNLKFAGQRGATGQDSKGFAIFPDEATGLAALKAQLRLYIKRHPDWSILQVMTWYLGGDPNNPQVTGEGDPFAYARAVAAEVGASIEARIGSFV